MLFDSTPHPDTINCLAGMLDLRVASRSFTREETRRLASILADTAQAEVMPRFRNLPEGAVRGKTSVRDLVTDADEAAERMISARLAKLYPGAVLIGEEASTRNPALLNMLVDADLAFLIDPIGRHPQLRGGPAAVRHDDRRLPSRRRDRRRNLRPCQPRQRAGRARRRRMDGIRERQAGAAGRGQSAPPEDMDGLISTGALPEPLRSTVNGNLSKLGSTVRQLRGP